MKKLGTLKLKDVSILSESEMKHVLGGSGSIGSGFGEREWHCLCQSPSNNAVDENGIPLPAKKEVTVIADKPIDAYHSAKDKCNGYEIVDCK